MARLVRYIALSLSFFSLFTCSAVNSTEKLQPSDTAFRGAALLACLNITEYGYTLLDIKGDLGLEVIKGPLAKKYPSKGNALLYPSSNGIVIIETKALNDDSACTVYLYSEYEVGIEARSGLELFLDYKQSPFVKQGEQTRDGLLTTNYLWRRDDFNISFVITSVTEKTDGSSLTTMITTHRPLEIPHD